MADPQIQAESPSVIGALDRILASEGGLNQPPPTQQAQQPQEPAPETPEPEVPAGPNKQVEGEPEVTQAAPQEIGLDELEAIELEVVTKGEDGKDVPEKLTVKALREGYMKDADYRRKTAELARQREQLSNETRKGVEAERIQYVTELQKMHDLVVETAAAELQGVNWKDLAQNNPFEYVRLDNRKKEITQALEVIQKKQKEVIDKHQAERKVAIQEAATKARSQLEEDIPGFNDALYQKLMQTGINIGFKPEEVSNWIDPRLIKLLHAASEGSKAKEETRTETPAPTKRVVVVPKVLKPGNANTNQTQQKQAAAMKQLQTSHNLADAAEVIKQRFGG